MFLPHQLSDLALWTLVMPHPFLPPTLMKDELDSHFWKEYFFWNWILAVCVYAHTYIISCYPPVTQRGVEWWREIRAVISQLAIPSPSRSSGPIWGNWELKKLETGKEDREQPKPAESQKTGFCAGEWKWLKVTVDLTLWPEIDSLEINCFLVVYLRAKCWEEDTLLLWEISFT